MVIRLMRLVIPSAKAYEHYSRLVEENVRRSTQEESRSDRARTAYGGLMFHAFDDTLQSNCPVRELKSAFSNKSGASPQDCQT